MSRQQSLIALNALVILSMIPGAYRAAAHFDAYELVWLILFFPAFTITFFWIVIVMVGHFIAADSYKDPKAIRQARQFLKVFDLLFWIVLALYEIAAIWIYSYFKS